MNSDFKKLVADCKQRLEDNGYSYKYTVLVINEWEELEKWMTGQNIDEFNEDVAFKYCDEKIGGHILYDGISDSNRSKLRAVRMLSSFQKTGSFEFRTPRVEKSLLERSARKSSNLSDTAMRKEAWHQERLTTTVIISLTSASSSICKTSI